MADLNERICIIGGGPAGVCAAMYLEKKGYTNYVIYEKDSRVGWQMLLSKSENGAWRQRRTQRRNGRHHGCKNLLRRPRSRSLWRNEP
jgi:cation diffusion facilitator CzcD-associated flavoprotein CzcO